MVYEQGERGAWKCVAAVYAVVRELKLDLMLPNSDSSQTLWLASSSMSEKSPVAKATDASKARMIDFDIWLT